MNSKQRRAARHNIRVERAAARAAAVSAAYAAAPSHYGFSGSFGDANDRRRARAAFGI